MLQKLFSFCLSSHQLFALSAVGFLHQKGVRVLIRGAVALSSAPLPRVLCWLLPAACAGAFAPAATLLSRALLERLGRS